ncbi:hypothetical protein J5N97_014493 [Dioscorea zingiberensis]|uniref:Oligopeptide transporter n=1 Tax=Dioscorea zingiberensis TaxID=325984 RepID=A0A9D5CU96_9LILI|nr:hypothetical protein J5N97_014493 [Dioscorea zingiberensis]
MGKNQKTQTSSSSSVAENNEPAESPVEQVRHTVPTTDDPTIPALTFRTWVLGVSACLIIYPSTSFFVFRQNPLFFSSTLTQIIMLPLGRLMASSLPKRLVRIPWFGFSFSLNPGPFSIKEHLLANTIAWGGYPSSLLIITSKRVFFSQDLNILPSFMMIISTQVYNVSRVLNPETNQLDLEAYNNYSKLYQSISFVFKSGFEFAALVASIVHVALLDGRSVWQQFIQAYKDEGTTGDVHNHLMRKYKAIPSWWYYSIIVISLGLGFAICEGFGKEFQLPFWGILLACALVLVFLPPLGVILATSSKIPSTATFAELIISYLYPGRPFANMTFNIYSSMSINTAFEFLYQLKLGHYMKIPPRHMFIAQISASVISSSISFFCNWWIISSVKNICQPDKLPKGSQWTCLSDRVNYNKVISWGVIGPQRLYYPDGLYGSMYYFFLIGLTDANYFNFWSWCAAGVLFHVVVLRRFGNEWIDKGYLLSAALDAGSIIAGFVISASLQLPAGVYGLSWWGLDFDDHCPLASCPTIPDVNVPRCPTI